MTEPSRELRPVESLHDRRRRYDVALRRGLAISAALHGAALLVLARALLFSPADTPTRTLETVELQGPTVVVVGAVLPPGAVADEGPSELLDPDPLPEDPVDRVVDPEDRNPAIANPVVRPSRDPGESTADLTNAERLQPQEGDERLWQEVPDDQLPEYLASNPYAAYEGEIRARLSMMLDSLNLSEAQRRRAMEWLSGEAGSEWGVSEDGIHLGGVVIPVNLQSLLAEEGPNGRESRQELRDLGAIRLQDMQGEAEDIRRERARQMRERSKEELERRLLDSLEAAGEDPEGEDDSDR